MASTARQSDWPRLRHPSSADIHQPQLRATINGPCRDDCSSPVTCVQRLLKILPMSLYDFGLASEGVLKPSHAGRQPKAYSNAKRPQPIVGPVPWTGNDRNPLGSK
jgi:hypothetical protein